MRNEHHKWFKPTTSRNAQPLLITTTTLYNHLWLKKLDIIYWYWLLKFYMKFLDAKIILNKNIINYKVLDLVEDYKFDGDLFPI